MKYYIDCEFDGYQGQLLSMAIVGETGKSMYVVMHYAPIQDVWVRENVIPVMFDCPTDVQYPCIFGATPMQLSMAIQDFMRGDEFPYVIADWPDDIKYLCEALITGPGMMIDIPGIKFAVERVDAYPTNVPGAIQHNAWWDAVALRAHLQEKSR